MKARGKNAKSVIWIQYEKVMVAYLPNSTGLRIIPKDSRFGDCYEAVIDLLTDSGSKVLKRLTYSLPVGTNEDAAKVLVSRLQAYAAALYPELYGIASNGAVNPRKGWFQLEGDLLREITGGRVIRIRREHLENGYLALVKLEILSERGFESFELPAAINALAGKAKGDLFAGKVLVMCIKAYAEALLLKQKFSLLCRGCFCRQGLIAGVCE